MEQLPNQFTEDPALKAALRRALDQEAAPAALRNRILALSAESAAETVEPPRSLKMPRRSPLFRFAVAAVLVIGFGALGYQIWQMNQGPRYDGGTVLTQALYKDMVDTHVARGAQTTPDPVTTLAAAGELSKATDRPVFVADLTRDGWTFRGAGVRKVGEHQATQLYFTKGKQAISVYSLPASAAKNAHDDQDYVKDFNGSPIAGFTHGKGLYCIVGSSSDDSLQVAEVKRLLAEHRGEISKG
jgi:hypothetical protein